jgi:hypothetical protein
LLYNTSIHLNRLRKLWQTAAAAAAAAAASIAWLLLLAVAALTRGQIDHDIYHYTVQQQCLYSSNLADPTIAIFELSIRTNCDHSLISEMTRQKQFAFISFPACDATPLLFLLLLARQTRQLGAGKQMHFALCMCSDDDYYTTSAAAVSQSVSHPASLASAMGRL